MKERLEELRRALNEATPGPWTVKWDVMSVETMAPRDPEKWVVFEGEPWDYSPNNRADYELIALARNSLPALLYVAEAAADLLAPGTILEVRGGPDEVRAAGDRLSALRVAFESLNAKDALGSAETETEGQEDERLD